MLVLTNWWWPYSQASILSALGLGYDCYVIVSKSDDAHWEWLNELYSHYGDRVTVQFDETPRDSKSAHTLTRFEYLPQVLKSLGRMYEQVMITDAEVIHQRRLSLEQNMQVALIESPLWPVEAVAHYGQQYDFPFYWSEMATRIVAECMIVRNSRRGIDFATRVAAFIEQIKADGFGDRWGADQVALFGACIRLPRDEIQYLTFDCDEGQRHVDVDAHPTAAVWYAMPYDRTDPGSKWSKAAGEIILKHGIEYNIERAAREHDA